MGRLKATWTPTQRELAKMLRGNGFEIKRYKGSHAIFENESGKVAVVPLNHPARKVTPLVWHNCKECLHGAYGGSEKDA